MHVVGHLGENTFESLKAIYLSLIMALGVNQYVDLLWVDWSHQEVLVPVWSYLLHSDPADSGVMFER